ncbi:MAG: lipoprotein-releasing system transmembrane subunit LolC [Gammaproteobacteria bacterium]|nr:lipoprotein-releasing system transmembrane subunit LolC [Gammaproteobacteria bacterium]HCL72798.1 lipoprotein-releasing system transmembrane subunit LolC [Gammaproteobacteria bacterium]
MLKPFSLFVGLRYSLARKHNLLLSFVSLISMLGVSLGVLILIVAMAVINGSITTLRDEALKSVPHATVSGSDLNQNWTDVRSLALNSASVLAADPFIEGEAMITHQGETGFIRVRGIDPRLELPVNESARSVFQELITQLNETENGIILGAQLAGQLGVYSNTDVSILGLRSLLDRQLDDSLGFDVLGFADFGLYGNNNIALVKLETAQKLFENDPGVSLQLRLRVDDVDNAGQIASEALADAPQLEVAPWNAVQASLFNALNMEKFLTTFMLLMIVVIGAVNIISTLVMVVSDKSADIAILRTMGASRQTIMQIFILQGLVAGTIGTGIGAVLGVGLANNITNISLGLERFVNSTFEGANIYLLSHLETEVNFMEVYIVCALALLVCFLATLYPAYRASCVQPAEVLRYE